MTEQLDLEDWLRENPKTLTEQWKKGELPLGYYYIETTDDGQVIDRYYRDCVDYETYEYGNVWEGRLEDTILEVLAPVPSYDHFVELTENVKENQQLKGYNEYLRNIIKECEPYIERECTTLNMTKFANGDFLLRSNELLSKIRNAIGEK